MTRPLGPQRVGQMVVLWIELLKQGQMGLAGTGSRAASEGAGYS